MLFEECEHRWNFPIHEPRVFGADGYLQLDHSITRQATILEDKAVAQGVLGSDNHSKDFRRKI
jgi:hypothetical protein